MGRVFAVMVLLSPLALFACSGGQSGPKPLPQGLPPEYEPPRAFDAGIKAAPPASADPAPPGPGQIAPP